jgi:predicted AlkP superfamily pyrophosphatase or phosphodiesterase
MSYRPFCAVLTLALTICAASAHAAKPATRPVGRVDRVVIISVDGLRPDLLARAYTPNIHGLMRSGSFTLWARTTAAAVTLPSHVSMLTGVTPKRHEIDWNRDLPLSKPVYPKGSTLFDLAHRGGYSTALVAGKSKFEVFARPGSLDWSWVAPKDAKAAAQPASQPATLPAETGLGSEEWPDDTAKAKKETLSDAVVAERAADIFREHRPDVTVVHFPHVDNVGHVTGWGTPEQVVAVEEADAAVGIVLRALRESGAIDSTLIVLSADHGGAGRTHGPDDARSRHIPWIAAGPGVRRDFDLTRFANLDVNTEDTFATACYFLGLRPSPRIDGKPVLQIIDTPELLQAAR